MNRRKRLDAFIAAAEKNAPVIGVDDCGPWVMRWIAAETGRDVPFPAYAARDDGYRIAAESGGLAALASRMFAPLGLAETLDPQLGDVGVIALRTHETACIFCKAGVAAIRREDFGVGFLRARAPTILKAWTVPGPA